MFVSSMSVIDRRSFLASASAVVLCGGRTAFAQSQSALLTVATRQIEVKRRGTMVFGITGRDGRIGHSANEGDDFVGEVVNRTSDPLVLHWHGQTFAEAFEDRSRPNGGALAPGDSDRHAFKLTPGTHWMHAHQLTEQQMLAAPMVTREQDAEDIQEVTVMLHDFAFRSPAEILAELGGSAGNAHGMGHPAVGGQSMPPMDHGAGHGEMRTHANDVRYDAFLANDRTLDDPDVVRVESGARVRLRVINGATATAFFINTGQLDAQCVAVDGSACEPLLSRRFPLAQGQRIDLVVTVPRAGGVFPILAQVEADVARTGLVLATPGANIRRIADAADTPAPHTDLSLDQSLRARAPLSARRADRTFQAILGEEPGYRWTINGAVHGEHRPLEARVGERVELAFLNPTSMMHPMHLHGHHFQVVAIGTQRLVGPIRDTVIVPPRTPVVVAVDLDKPGSWFLHCHHLYHMATGMMTEISVRT
jgi:FtsP/CotA-like multicopper oxidase with cupredoxin domain